MTLAHEEIIDFILAGKTPQEVINFHASEGVKARVTPVAFPELSYDGTCAAPAAKPGAAGLSFTVTVNPGDVDPRILPGMKATVRIDGGEADGILLLLEQIG